jgi:hypothetical protein
MVLSFERWSKPKTPIAETSVPSPSGSRNHVPDDIRTMQELHGHADLTTTMVYTPGPNRGDLGASRLSTGFRRSPHPRWSVAPYLVVDDVVVTAN